MSAGDLAFALSHLVEAHGSVAVLETLRDACHGCSDFLSGDDGVRAEMWKKAGDAIGFAAVDVRSAEATNAGPNAFAADLASSLGVLADIGAES